MALIDLTDWMNEHTGQNIIWYVKRLAANDTLASGAHQAGAYIPRGFILDIFPSMNNPEAENPDKWFDLYIDSHGGDARKVRAVWYNNKITGAPCYLTKFRDSCHLNSFTYAANGRCPERPASVTTTHKSRFVITPSNGWTAIRNAILASLARYRALRLSELPCRLSGTKNHHFASAPFP